MPDPHPSTEGERVEKAEDAEPALLVLQHLIHAGVDLDTRARSDGRTALCAAAAAGHTEAVRLLAACGAEIEAYDQEDSTPLLLAAVEGRAETVRVLLQLGESPMESSPHTPSRSWRAAR